MKANRIAPDVTPRFAALHLGLFCLPMPHKKDTRLILVKVISKATICHIVFFHHAASASVAQKIEYMLRGFDPRLRQTKVHNKMVTVTFVLTLM